MWKKVVVVGLALLGVGIIAAKVIVPGCVTSPRESRARVLATDVATMRAIVGKYTLDLGRRPSERNNPARAPFCISGLRQLIFPVAQVRQGRRKPSCYCSWAMGMSGSAASLLGFVQ